MGKNDYVVGIDIGSANVRLILGEINASGSFSVITHASGVAEGMRKGAVTNPDLVSVIIRALCDQVKRTTGITVRTATIGLGDHRLETHLGRGAVAISRADDVIGEEDMARALANAEETLPRLANRAIVYREPHGFRIDGEVAVADPKGMSGRRLEADMLFVTTFQPYYRQLADALELSGIRADGVTAGIIANGALLLSRRQKEIGVLLMNFGAQTTEVGVWEEGKLISLEVFPIGSLHITNDIALGFQIHVDDAEVVKRSFASLMDMSKREVSVDLPSTGATQIFSQRKLQDIVSARLSDIFELTAKHLKRIDRTSLLPGGVVITGGGAQLPGIVDHAKKELKLPAFLGAPEGIGGKASGVSGTEWTTALGLAYVATQEIEGAVRGESKILNAIIRFVKQLIP